MDRDEVLRKYVSNLALTFDWLIRTNQSRLSHFMLSHLSAI